jgi:hypothetical protein
LGIPPLASPDELPEADVIVTTVAELVTDVLLAEMVVGPEAELLADDEPDAAVEPDEVMLNCWDWARIAALLFDEDMRLIWKAVPTGQEPEGYVTVAELTTLEEPVDWLAVSVMGELERKPAWGVSKVFGVWVGRCKASRKIQDGERGVARVGTDLEQQEAQGATIESFRGTGE